VEIYFALAGLTKTISHADGYVGKIELEVDISNCEGASLCSFICASLFKGEMSMHGDAEAGSPPKIPRYCRKRSRDQIFDKCWETVNMRCWNQHGGNYVWDGTQEWFLRRHFQGWDSESDDEERGIRADKTTMRWMHLIGDGLELVIFGWGKVVSIEAICLYIQRLPELSSIHEHFAPENSILIAGHSEGSAWAICFERMLTLKKVKNPRHIVTSGSLVATKEFHRKTTPLMKDNSLHLLVETEMPDFMRLGIMPDIMTTLKPLEGTTFPQYGYGCGPENTCISWDQPIDIAAGFARAHELRRMGPGLETVLKEIHSFRNYRECFHICKKIWSSSSGFNFQTNTPSWTKPVTRQNSAQDDDRVPALPFLPCKIC